MNQTAWPIAAVLCLCSAVAQGQDRLQPDFTFKRVGVPASGGSRITVQVDPSAPPATMFAARPQAIATPDGSIAPVPQPSGLDWFWSTISTSIADSGPGRLEQALQVIAEPPAGQAVPAPRLQSLQDIAAIHGVEILKATVGTRVSPALVLALISVESAGNAQAVSRAGAQGLMQLMPDTATRFDVTDSLSPSQNIRGGVAYLDWLMNKFDNDPILVLAGYNAGEGSVRDNAGVPPFPETRGYVPKVLAAFAVARGLCLTPPELVSDGCVFAVSRS
ncbi:Transglycosylase SLT domain-containing protein [Loktanella fryxellensis]|uniref:Transglycosylase SLT domain-containing protein n=1 Tax=Loktanella fryxellensis TaxID=245187 RepID=A0A1H8FYQ0_9RHOB|nr:lytic transglycosylase domain-containing protein [Loktanella fryxellensis]SEN36971.1 Transglycosylase SLT domain-containing protein [Loktanella fryxellensis]